MKRLTLPLALLLGLLTLAPVAMATDASLKQALKKYEKKMASDIAYLSAFKAPSKSGAKSALNKIAKVEKDLKGVQKAASGQQSSTSSGKTGRTDVLNAVHDALVASGDAQKSAKAARSGHKSTAKADAKATIKETNKAIPLFETGGTLLHLF